MGAVCSQWKPALSKSGGAGLPGQVTEVSLVREVREVVIFDTTCLGTTTKKDSLPWRLWNMPTSFQLSRFIHICWQWNNISIYFSGPRRQAILGEQPLPHSQCGPRLSHRVPGSPRHVRPAEHSINNKSCGKMCPARPGLVMFIILTVANNPLMKWISRKINKTGGKLKHFSKKCSSK